MSNRDPYFAALDAADAAYKSDLIDVSKMEALIGAMLAEQLKCAYEAASGQRATLD